MADCIIVSTPFVPGYKITKNVGFTWGLIVRSRGLGGNIVAGLRTIADRMKEHATAMGANAVISVGFDSSEIGQSMTEVLAYGTAVVVEPETAPTSPVRLT